MHTTFQQMRDLLINLVKHDVLRKVRSKQKVIMVFDHYKKCLEALQNGARERIVTSG